MKEHEWGNESGHRRHGGRAWGGMGGAWRSMKRPWVRMREAWMMHGRGMEGGMGGHRECMGGHRGGMTRAWDGMGRHVGWHWKSIKDVGVAQRGAWEAWGDMKGAWWGHGKA